MDTPHAFHQDDKELKLDVSQKDSRKAPEIDEERFAELYPQLDQKERHEAVTNLRRYFEIALAIGEERTLQHGSLTRTESLPTMKERSQENLKI